jgi:autotransporter-associated beta strand protein
MKPICLTIQRKRRALTQLLVLAAMVAVVSIFVAPTFAQRVFGLDTSSAANFDVSQAQWNAAYNSGYAAAGIPSFQFAIVRSSHGGTNGVSPASDDAQFYQNITRATAAGMLAGSYHFPHADVYTAADDAQHYLNHAGMYMKPGFLLPVLDLEGSSNALSTAALTTWSIDFINTIAQAKGINPIVYTSSSFNTDEVTAAVAFTNIASSPHTGERTYQWLARPSGSLTTGQPVAASGYPDPYGGWDPNFTTKSGSVDPAVKPWAFWQNGNAHIDPSGTSGHQFLIDFDAANGNIEFVKDFLVPALWTNAGSGDWGITANWNSDNPTYNGTIESGPAPRLPNNQSLDWVKLQNNGGGTVTISGGARTVRKFYTQQPLNITAGSLVIGYVPGSGGKWNLPSEFNAAVTLSSGAAYSAHTTQVDGGGGQFNINGGTITFSDIQLVSHATNAGKIVLSGDVTLDETDNAGTSMFRSMGALAQAGSISLTAGSHTLTVDNGSASLDVSIQVVMSGTGAFVKAGAGTMELTSADTYTGGTTVSAGLLSVSGAAAKLGTGNVSVLGTTNGAVLAIQSGVTNAIDNTALLSLFGGGTPGVADRGYAQLAGGINETVSKLSLNGALQGPGTYGSTSSGATFKNNEYFSGSGIITVLIPEPASVGLLLLGLTALAGGRRRQ